MNKILMFLISSVVILSASSFEIGSSLSILDNYKYETPQGRIVKVPAKSTLIIVVFEKAMGTMVNGFLTTTDKYYLQKNHAVFIADIHLMPRVLTNMFVLPKMKKYKHLLYLHYEKDFHKIVPHKSGYVTLLRVDEGKISKITYTNVIQDIQLAIEQ